MKADIRAWTLTALFLILLLYLPTLAHANEQAPIRAVRFDAGYYYGTGRSVDDLARLLVDRWSEAGANTVYYMSYSPVYGARYRTTYLHNRMEDFGRQDLLGAVLRHAKDRGMKVIAWFFDHQHKGAWDAHPQWRVKTKDGSYYRVSEDDYFLSVHHPEVREYWQGFVADLLERYPDLDGVDITEPIINWWGNQADFSDYCREEFTRQYPGEPLEGALWNQFRSEGLTIHIKELTDLIHSYGKQVHVTSGFTSRPDGTLYPPLGQKDLTGFDLEAILSGEDVPDYLNAEVIWQQWADEYGDAFDPSWTGQAASEVLDQVRGRAEVIVHVELSLFGEVAPQRGQLATSMDHALRSGAEHLDFYDTYQADTWGRWGEVRKIYTTAAHVTDLDPTALSTDIGFQR